MFLKAVIHGEYNSYKSKEIYEGQKIDDDN